MRAVPGKDGCHAPPLIRAFLIRDRDAVDAAIAEWNEDRVKAKQKPITSPIHVLGQLVRPAITGGTYEDGAEFDHDAPAPPI